MSFTFGFWVVIVAALVMVGPLSVRGGPADAAGWELIFTDTFDRKTPGKDWEVVKGSWTIEGGALVGSGTVVSARGFPGPDPHRLLPGRPPPGFIRLEFDVRMGPGAPSEGVPDWSALIHVPPCDSNACPTQTGYCFHFGGTAHPRLMIRRAGKTMVERDDAEAPLQAGTLHRCVVENDEGTLRLIVDGKTVFEQKETASLMGDGFDRVGFHCEAITRLERVRVYVKRLDDGYI